MEIRLIVCATDYSEASERALPTAVEVAARFGAELAVLHVVPRLVDVVPVAAGVPPVEIEAEAGIEASARTRLEAWLRERVSADVPAHAELADGDPAEEIVAFARTAGAGLIVMGTQGHSALERFFVGSVTEAVLRRSGCPVLAVPTGRRREREAD